MNVITREWFDLDRGATFTLVPIGDVHLGTAACDEVLLESVVKRIAQDDHCLWVGLGDYIEAIGLHDKRFNPEVLAPWACTARALGTLATAERDHILDILKPISRQCLGLIEGNHEEVYHRNYERNLYSEMVVAIRQWSGLAEDAKLGFGYSGWLDLDFHRAIVKSRSPNGSRIRISLHHGFVAGRLGGGKALSMERWLWTHDADLTLMGHGHNTASYMAGVEFLDKCRNVTEHVRRGAYCGTFMRNTVDGATTYAERRGYLPLPMGGCEITLRPGATEQRDRVRITI